VNFAWIMAPIANMALRFPMGLTRDYALFVGKPLPPP